MEKVKQEKETAEVREVTLATGEIVEVMTSEKFRQLPLTSKAEALVKVKRFLDFLKKLYNEWEPLVRTEMDFARNDATEINQVRVGDSVVHLGAGKEDRELGVSEVEDFWGEMSTLAPHVAKLCFKEIHKPDKAEITKARKQKGEAGSVERQLSDMIERYYNPQPKKLEIKEA